MKNGELILLVDDEPDLLESCVRILEDEEYNCVTTTDSTEVIDLVAQHNPSVIVTDFIMPEKNGMDVLNEVRAEYPDIPVVMISAYATINGVVEAVKSGAFDYLTKPFSTDQLVITIRRALEQFHLQKENKGLKKRLRDDFFNHHFVGKHPKFLKTVELIQKAAETESSILIQGETGTGKELAARAIHLLCRRADGPFLVVDCSAISKEMIEAAPANSSGSGEGAKKSIFEAADGGTLYLENVEQLDPVMQTRLIRILQDRKVPRGDEWEWVPVDVRFIASTTVDLYSAMIQKEFRENLYYSLNVVNIAITPLRERKEDIGILCDHFFRQIAEKDAIEVPTIHTDALAKLMEYSWPGNVRQLVNVVEGAVSLSENKVLMLKNLPDEIRHYNGSHGLSFKDARNKWLQQFEKHYVENLLLTNKGNISRASEMAGVARMSLYRMLKRTGLQELVNHERLVERNHAHQPIKTKSQG